MRLLARLRNAFGKKNPPIIVTTTQSTAAKNASRPLSIFRKTN
jgi:hypothetical protein